MNRLDIKELQNRLDAISEDNDDRYIDMAQQDTEGMSDIEMVALIAELYSRLDKVNALESSEEATEGAIEEGDAELAELNDIMGRSGVMGFKN